MTGHSRPYNKAINITLENAESAAGLLLPYTFYRITHKRNENNSQTLAKTDLLLLFPLKALRLLYVLTSFFLISMTTNHSRSRVLIQERLLVAQKLMENDYTAIQQYM